MLPFKLALKKSSDSFKNVYQQNLFTNEMYFILMHKQDLALINQLSLICHNAKLYHLWLVRDQKGDTEEEKVDRICVLNNRIYIQNRSVRTAGRRFDCWEEVGIYRSSYRLEKCGERLFLCGSVRRTVAHKGSVAPEMSQVPSAFL